MSTNKKYKAVICIPDLHLPYHHKDSFLFLDSVHTSVAKRFPPHKRKQELLITCLGDEIDGHSWSFHKPDPRLANPNKELDEAIFYLQDLYTIFPTCRVIDSNHGSLLYRKYRDLSLPMNALQPINEILGAPKGWKWSFDLTVNLSNNTQLYLHHGKTGRAGALSKNMCMNAVQGHFHSKFQITYHANPNGYLWDAHAGCLIDNDPETGLAFEYGKNTLDRPILGCLVVLEGVPILVPMILDKKGSWIGKTCLD